MIYIHGRKLPHPDAVALTVAKPWQMGAYEPWGMSLCVALVLDFDLVIIGVWNFSTSNIC